jgi:hypothetical protein
LTKINSLNDALGHPSAIDVATVGAPVSRAPILDIDRRLAPPGGGEMPI